MTHHLETMLITVVTYLFLRYIWEPRLLPYFDSLFRYNVESFKKDLDTIRVYLDKDWTQYKTLPNPKVYYKTYLRVIKHVDQYTNGQCLYLLEGSVGQLYDQYSIVKPKPIEIVAVNNFIHEEVLPTLDRVLSQVN